LLQLVSIQVSLPQTLPGEDVAGAWAKPWTTGFHKQPAAGPVWLGRTNLAGDGQADLVHHGGPDKAVNAYPAEHYSFWRERLTLEPRLPPAEAGTPTFLPHGSFGENFTLSGLSEDLVCIGDAYRVGEALVQISQPRQPCWKMSRRWRIKELAAWVVGTGRTGWYFRVLREGEVSAGMEMTLVERPHPEWTIAAANRVMHVEKHNPTAAAALAACPLLSASWREELAGRK
jgi:MOSC domain-containing protein YiiM